jgi:hypothetical protein
MIGREPWCRNCSPWAEAGQGREDKEGRGRLGSGASALQPTPPEWLRGPYPPGVVARQCGRLGVRVSRPGLGLCSERPKIMDMYDRDSGPEHTVHTVCLMLRKSRAGLSWAAAAEHSSWCVPPPRHM